MNKLDKTYTDLLQDIIANGTPKKDRTGTGTISVFGRQIRHNMQDGFPVLTTKKMSFKSIVAELIWFLRGDTNIKFLLENGCHIWDGDAYANYVKWNQFNSNPHWLKPVPLDNGYNGATLYSQEEFVEKILTDNEFCNKWGDLGPIYGSGWRNFEGVDQIKELITSLKTEPDSRRLMVSAWQPHKLKESVLPPCHYGFQVYTRELTFDEFWDKLTDKQKGNIEKPYEGEKYNNIDCRLELMSLMKDMYNIPTRAISLMWNQRSCDLFLGIPFNIASYGLLLTLLAELTNMVPDELIGNLGDVHLYNNHIEQAKEQIGRDYTFEEREAMYPNYMDIITPDMIKCEKGMEQWYIDTANHWDAFRAFIAKKTILSSLGVPEKTREPFELPKLRINTEFWLTESGECGIGPLNVDWFLDSLRYSDLCKALLNEDIQLVDYKSHEAIKAPLSN